MQIVQLSECKTSRYMGRNRHEQWAYTEPGCAPAGDGWNLPIPTEDEHGNERWLWKRDASYAEEPANV